ncbi:MAG: electron transport complex subunit E [Victivallaceae bacterium]|nr:electron transport complex subunit E [Victivallaceae bacterium]
MSLIKDFTRGIWKENPVLVMLLGMCPTLAVTTNAENGLSMGVATTFVLLGCNIVISLVRNIVPKKIRIPVYIVVIATFVTVVELLMSAYAPPAINKSLGIFIPLIVVNCIVLGRAEAFASKTGVFRSIMDALGMGLGFSLALAALGGTREFLATGSLFQIKIIIPWTVDFMLWTGAPGAFIILGCFLAGMNKLNMRKAVKSGKVYIPPQGLGCSHCRLCDIGVNEE